MSAKQKRIGFVNFISWPFGRKTAVERERECPDSRQSEGTGFRNRLSGKVNVIEFDLSWWIIIQGGKFELPGLACVLRNIDAVHVKGS